MYYYVLILFILVKLEDLWASWQLNQPAVQETQVRPLGWEGPLETEMATHSSILAWRIPRTEKQATVQGVTKSQTWLSCLSSVHKNRIILELSLFCSWIYKWVNREP